MARPGAVLLLLLVTSAAAGRYRWLDPVSLHGPAVQILSAESEIDCGLLCEEATPEECSGFIYGPDDGTCRLFSGDCRGPAVNSSQQTTERYMARSKCPGKHWGDGKNVHHAPTICVAAASATDVWRGARLPRTV